MSEAAAHSLDSNPARCVSCGAEGDAQAAAEPGRCLRCDLARAAREGEGPSPVETLAGPDLASRLRFLERKQQVLAELLSAGPPSEGPKMIESLNAGEKRRDSLLAFVPLVGPWLIQRSRHLERKEKQTLTALSLGLTLVIFAVIWTLMPNAADRLASLRERMQLEMQVLGDVVERYRLEHGSYPDEATWKWFAKRADGRFFDPWGRPYLYEPHVDGVTLRTLGRDGREGGSGKDADVTVERLNTPRVLRGRS